MKIRNYSSTEMKDFLAKLAIFIIAFDSFPIFIGGSIYRPVSVFPLLFYFILLFQEDLVNGSFKKRYFYLLLEFVFLLVISFIKSALYEDNEGVIDFFLTGTLGYVAFVSFDDYFKRVRAKCISQDQFFNEIGKIYMQAMIIPSIYGIIEIPVVMLHIRSSFFSTLFSLVTYRFSFERIFLVCGEPSWAVLYLIVFFYFIIFCSEVKYKKTQAFICCGLILFTFSMLGYMSIAIAFAIYYVFYLIKNPNKLPVFIIIIGVIILVVLGVDKIMTKGTPIAYLNNRYGQIKELFTYVLQPEMLYKYIQISDSSLFLRFVNPIIGLMICCQHPLFGIGGGYFYIDYPKIIFNYFPLAVDLEEVRGAAYNEYHTTSKNIFTRCYAEFGIIIGSIVFLKFILKLTKIPKKDKRGLFLLTLIFTVVFNFDSLCYILFLFLLAFFNVYSQRYQYD